VHNLKPLPLLAIPRFEGQRGHPIFFRRDLIPEFLPVIGPLDDIVVVVLALSVGVYVATNAGPITPTLDASSSAPSSA
jgi:CTP:molybdopterin cytidylyltransferase MocA